MDLINNLVFTALNKVESFNSLAPDFFDKPPELGGATISPNRPSVFPFPVNRGNFYSYNTNVIEEFCAIDDSKFIENSIQKHWADMVMGRNYIGDIINPGSPSNIVKGKTVTSFTEGNSPTNLIPPYHMIYAYLVENTRIAQIFERLLFLYMHDEKLTKATGNKQEIILAFQWMMNTESLFYSNLSNTNYRNTKTQIRENAESTRRNAYYRMFGMDLAFGDLQSNATINYYKAEFNNQPLIILFEKFLSEIWQAYTNARNTSGANSTDMFSIIDTAQKLQEMLMSRRTTENNFNNYRYFNLSKEEYASVVMMSWLYEAVSYNSPVVKFLSCNGNTPGERLINIGNKVGVNAHTKSEGLLDIAPPMNTLFRRIELGDYNVEIETRTIIESQTPTSTASISQRQALTEILQIINNWEKATGHKIKNAQSNITGSVRVQQNGVKEQTAMN